MRQISILFFLIFTACSHQQTDTSRYLQLVVVGTNDVHGFVRTSEFSWNGQTVLSGGAEWFAGYVRNLEKKHGNRLVLLDGGDIFQGTLESNPVQGESLIKFYNLLPYRAAAIGNHEFDFGPVERGNKDRLGAIKARMREAKFPFLTANTYLRGTGKVWNEANLHPHTLFEVEGVKVGVIGLTTETTRVKTNPLYVQGLEWGSLADATLREVQAVRAKGATVVLIAMHEGDGHGSNPLTEMLDRLPPGTIDGIVSGHTHLKVNEFVRGVPVIQAGARGFHFARFDLFVDRSTGRVVPDLTRIHPIANICGTWFANGDECFAKGAQEQVEKGHAKDTDFFPLRKPQYEGELVSPDLKVRAVLAPYLAKADRVRGEVLGHAHTNFERHPSGENDVGQLFMKAYSETYPDAKIVYFNGGGFRRMLNKGAITYGDLFEVNPFDNFVVKVKLTGRDLRKLLEVGFSGMHSVPQIHGVKVTYHDRSDAEFDRDTNGDGKKEKWERNRIAKLTWENGKSVLDQETFWLVTNDYLVMGGDNMDVVFHPLADSKKAFQDANQRDVVANWLRRHPKASLPLPVQNRIFTAP